MTSDFPDSPTKGRRKRKLTPDQEEAARGRQFVQQVAPDDDYLPPVELERPKRPQTSPGPTKRMTVPNRKGQKSTIDAPPTIDEYHSPEAPPPARRPDPVTDYVPGARPETLPDEWVGFESPISGGFIADDEDGQWRPQPLPPGAEGDGWIVVSPPADERSQWEIDLGLDEDWWEREADERALRKQRDNPTLAAWRAENVAGALCGNPAGCVQPVKAKGRCGPCLEYRRTHKGQERPKKLINRLTRRKGS